VNRLRTVLPLIAGAAVIVAALATVTRARADEDEEKPITSGAAQVSRDAAGEVLIALRPATQKEIGLTTETLKRVVRPIEAEAYGFVLDPSPLSQLNSSLLSARAALDASSAQYRRSKRLYAEQKNASLRALQSAQATYLSDQARLEALEHQIRDQWGGGIAKMNPRERGELISALIERRQAIARVTAPIGEALDEAPREAARVRVLGHERQPLTARAVYSAPAVVPTMQGQTFLLLIDTGTFPVRPGTAVSAYLPTTAKAEQGVMVPRSAVVRYAGKEWVYRALDGNRFVRQEIMPAESTADGYFVTRNLAPGMRVVVTGAQTLLSQELKARIQMED
jgi:hypothetical protein